MIRSLTRAFSLALALAAGLLAGCGGEEEAGAPIDRALEHLEQSEEAVERATEQARQLGQTIETRQEELESLGTRQINLLDQRIGTFRDRLARLPAPQETELRGELQQLEQQREQVAATLERYIAAEPAQAPRIRQEFQQQLTKLQDSFEQFEQNLSDAGV